VVFLLLPRHRARIKRLDDEAEALILEFGVDAYAEARRKEFEASSDTIARDWGRIAVAISKRTGLKVVRGTPSDPDLALANEPVAELRPSSGSRPLDHLNRSVCARPQQFRVQFLGATRARKPLLLEEVGIEAADVSAAVVAAANLTLPPKTIGLHIVDREGRKVFVRERTNLRSESPSRSGLKTRLSGLRPWALS
jgi:hypothetical protein